MAEEAICAADAELVVSRWFDAPRELVFKVWTEPQHLAKWWGPQGFSIVSCDLDVRPGGRWRRCMRAPDGTVHSKLGVYREIVAPERLVFTYADEDASGICGHETLVTVSFTESGGKTKLVLHQTAFETQAARRSHQVGWGSCLERLADYVAQNRTTSNQLWRMRS